MLNTHNSHSAAERARLAEMRKFAEAEHAKSLAAEQRMRAAQDPSLISWYGAVVTVFLLALICGVFLIANYLGN